MTARGIRVTEAMSMRRFALLLSTGAIICIMAGCALHAEKTDASLAAPEAWRYSQSSAAADADVVSAEWWHSFGSAEFDQLVEAAQAQSFDVAAATARVRQAQASARMAGASLLPEVSGTAGANRHEGRHVDATTAFSAGLAASYEVDFWGGNRALRDAAVQTALASEFDRDTVRLTVTAGVASTWLQAMGLRERVVIAERNLTDARRLLGLVESRARAGAATPLELAQQRGLVATQERTLAALRQQAGDAQVALAVLLGSATQMQLQSESLLPLRAPAIDAGVPSELLLRRPDLARSEAQLRAADANIVAARAAMLPSLTLTATVGTGGDRLRRVFDNPLYSAAAGLTAPIFNGGRLAAGRDLAEAQREELLARYRGAIVNAFGDVESALNAVAGIEAQRAAQAEELAQAQRAQVLAESRYRVGADTLLTLLDAQRTLYAAQDAAVQLQALRLQAAVSLYRALGGGWSLHEPQWLSGAAR
jgi:multidrug efflux system outer membrane protein